MLHIWYSIIAVKTYLDLEMNFYYRRENSVLNNAFVWINVSHIIYWVAPDGIVDTKGNRSVEFHTSLMRIECNWEYFKHSSHFTVATISEAFHSYAATEWITYRLQVVYWRNSQKIVKQTTAKKSTPFLFRSTHVRRYDTSF